MSIMLLAQRVLCSLAIEHYAPLPTSIMLLCQGIFKIQNLIIDGKANIEWKNEAATRLLASAVDEQQEHTWALKAPKTVDDLRFFHPDLPQLLRDLRPGSLHVIQVHRQEEGTQLALSGMEYDLYLTAPLPRSASWPTRDKWSRYSSI